MFKLFPVFHYYIQYLMTILVDTCTPEWLYYWDIFPELELSEYRFMHLFLSKDFQIFLQL